MQLQNLTRQQLAVFITQKLTNQKEKLSAKFEKTKESIGYFFVDELIPKEIAIAIHNHSWHSVSRIISDDAQNCVSNYYFSSTPINKEDRFHVTTFRGWPHQKIRNQILKLDSTLRMGLRKIFRKGIIEIPHVYKKIISKFRNVSST